MEEIETRLSYDEEEKTEAEVLNNSHLECWTVYSQALQWSPESSILLRSLGWNPPYYTYDPLTDDNIGLESFHLIGGDIIPDYDGDEDRTELSKNDKLWPMGRVPYTVSTKLSQNIKTIKTAMKNIENVTCIRFIPKTSEKNYIRIFKGQGCSSRVGMGSGAQNLSLGSGCYKVGKITHELLHALGFYHEHSRSDRDKYIDIHWNNIQQGHQKNFVKMKHDQEMLLTPYDYNSIMHYSEYSFSKDKTKGLKTMTPKKRGAVLKSPGVKVLSPSDIKRIVMLYKC